MQAMTVFCYNNEFRAVNCPGYCCAILLLRPMCLRVSNTSTLFRRTLSSISKIGRIMSGSFGCLCSNGWGIVVMLYVWMFIWPLSLYVMFHIMYSIIILSVLDGMCESFAFYNGYLFHAGLTWNYSLICIYISFKNCVLYFVYVIKCTRGKYNQSLMVYYF